MMMIVTTRRLEKQNAVSSCICWQKEKADEAKEESAPSMSSRREMTREDDDAVGTLTAPLCLLREHKKARR